MNRPNNKNKTFVLTVCGDEGVEDVNFCLMFIKKWVKDPVCVIASRVTLPINHDWVVHVNTPSSLNNLQTSRYLKTGIQKHIPIKKDTIYCYLDNDVFLLSEKIYKMFELFTGTVLFAHDHKMTVETFSGWCLHYGSLDEAIEKYFSVKVEAEWRIWNSGVYLFDHTAIGFLNTWNEMVCATFDLPQWIVKDQGPLVATVWKYGLQHRSVLPPEYNWLFGLSEFDKVKCDYTSEGFRCGNTDIIVVHFYGGDTSKVTREWLNAFEYVFGKNSLEYRTARKFRLKIKLAKFFNFI